MKLHYFKAENGNFGDDLNPWLWERLLPGFFDEDDSEIFVAIGTLLNHRLPREPRKHIFGSGYGYGDPPLLDESFHIHAIRGYETAKLLGIDKSLVITDSAVLLRKIPFRQAPVRDFSFGFIPHYQSCHYFDWEPVCAALGYHFISVEWDVPKVLLEMSRCEVLICEAMHGAIAADSLRIPWIPVVCYDYIFEFKWRDWLSTLSLPYSPSRITSLYDVERALPIASRTKNAVKRGLKRVGVWSNGWTPPPAGRTDRTLLRQAMIDLSAASERTPLLSKDALLTSHLDRYSECLEKLTQHTERNPRTLAA